MRKTSGVSLMLLIFLSLCLITFSLLSLSGATADETLSQKSADRTTQYYAAVTSANEIISRIDAALAGYLKKAETADDPKSSYINQCASISLMSKSDSSTMGVPSAFSGTVLSRTNSSYSAWSEKYT